MAISNSSETVELELELTRTNWTGTLTYYWKYIKLVQPLQTTAWKFLV